MLPSGTIIEDGMDLWGSPIREVTIKYPSMKCLADQSTEALQASNVKWVESDQRLSNTASKASEQPCKKELFKESKKASLYKSRLGLLHVRGQREDHCPYYVGVTCKRGDAITSCSAHMDVACHVLTSTACTGECSIIFKVWSISVSSDALNLISQLILRSMIIVYFLISNFIFFWQTLPLPSFPFLIFWASFLALAVLVWFLPDRAAFQLLKTVELQQKASTWSKMLPRSMRIQFKST